MRSDRDTVGRGGSTADDPGPAPAVAGDVPPSTTGRDSLGGMIKQHNGWSHHQGIMEHPAGGGQTYPSPGSCVLPTTSYLHEVTFALRGGSDERTGANRAQRFGCREGSPTGAFDKPISTRAPMTTRCGTFAIVGKPNVGKSTLLNALVGEKLAIVSRKPQATREPVIGVRTDPDVQFVFVDLPGLLDPEYLMHEAMREAAVVWVRKADAVLHLHHASTTPLPSLTSLAPEIEASPKRPEPVRIVTAAALFDGHDAAIMSPGRRKRAEPLPIREGLGSPAAALRAIPD